MSTVRISLPNSITIEATPEQAVEILSKISAPAVVETEAQRAQRIKAKNATLQPKIKAEFEELQNKIKPKKAVEPVKTIIQDLPITAQLKPAESRMLSDIFYYLPNKASSKGKAPYIAAILMDRQIHNLQELKRLANCPTSTITFVVRRLREAGWTVETTSEIMSKSTLIQLTKIAKPKFKVSRVPRRTGSKAQSTSKPGTNSPIVIPKGFTDLAIG